MNIAGSIDRSSPANQDSLRMFIMWGQSHVHGGADNATLTDRKYHHDRDAIIPGAFIWDKFGRPNRQSMDLTDGSRGGEAHSWRPMQQGYNSAINWPWDGAWSGDTNSWEMLFAHLWRQHRGERIFLIKMGFGGTTLADRDGAGTNPYWSASALGLGNQSYLQVLMEAYYAEALKAALVLVGGDRSKITFGGIFSLIGTSELFDAGAVANYDVELQAIINYQRSVIAPADPTAVPYAIVKSPRGQTAIDINIDSVRAKQEAAAVGMVNVSVLDTTECEVGPDNLHLSSMGNDQLGGLCFRWAVQQLGYVGPHGEAV